VGRNILAAVVMLLRHGPTRLGRSDEWRKKLEAAKLAAKPPFGS
jgi:hypothetical protein